MPRASEQQEKYRIEFVLNNGSKFIVFLDLYAHQAFAFHAAETIGIREVKHSRFEQSEVTERKSD
jgi:hypothetical protein